MFEFSVFQFLCNVCINVLETFSGKEKENVFTPQLSLSIKFFFPSPHSNFSIMHNLVVSSSKSHVAVVFHWYCYVIRINCWYSVWVMRLLHQRKFIFEYKSLSYLHICWDFYEGCCDLASVCVVVWAPIRFTIKLRKTLTLRPLRIIIR